MSLAAVLYDVHDRQVDWKNKTPILSRVQLSAGQGWTTIVDVAGSGVGVVSMLLVRGFTSNDTELEIKITRDGVVLEQRVFAIAYSSLKRYIYGAIATANHITEGNWGGYENEGVPCAPWIGFNFSFKVEARNIIKDGSGLNDAYCATTVIA